MNNPNKIKMVRGIKKDKDIIENTFNVNPKYKLTDDEEDYLEELKEALYNLIREQGTVSNSKIKEIILDDLLKNRHENIINYLGLEISEDIGDGLEKKVNDENFLKREDSEDTGDFFDRLLNDDTLNDLTYSLMGYERKAEGSKEIFLKKRSAKIPTQRIIAIGDILKSKFNKTEFLSQKDDIEQAHLILMAFDSIFDILLEIPYDMCDTATTIEIMGMITIKLSNAIGLSKNLRTDILKAVETSYQSKKEMRDKKGGLEND